MNGSFVRKYQARATRSVVIASLRSGGVLEVTKGDLFEVTEDSYGNTYVYDAEGREFSLFDLEEVDTA